MARSLLLVLFAPCCLFLCTCASLDKNVAKPFSVTHLRPEESTLWQPWTDRFETEPEKSGFYLLANGIDAYAARLHLIDNAEHTLDLQYYMIHADTSGRHIIHHLVSAAERGVRVRVLIDDLYALGFDREIATLAWHPKIEIRIFNPRMERMNFILRSLETIFHLERINSRMHNKLMVADNAAMIMGGRNLGDEYFDLNEEMNFRDLDVLAIGPLVRDATASFDSYWNSDMVLPIEARKDIRPTEKDFLTLQKQLSDHALEVAHSEFGLAVNNSPLKNDFINEDIDLQFAKGKVLADHPEKYALSDKERDIHFLTARMKRVIPLPEEEFIASSPYFIPGPSGVNILTALVDSGVKVKLLTNSYYANDVKAVHSAYSKYRKPLLRGGVSISELKKIGDTNENDMSFDSADASLHAKAFIIDREVVFIGSLNLDPRSVIHNTETGVLIQDAVIAEKVAALLNEAASTKYSYQLQLDEKNDDIIWTTRENGEEVSLTKEPNLKLRSRIYHFILRLLPLEHQL